MLRITMDAAEKMNLNPVNNATVVESDSDFAKKVIAKAFEGNKYFFENVMKAVGEEGYENVNSFKKSILDCIALSISKESVEELKSLYR